MGTGTQPLHSRTPDAPTRSDGSASVAFPTGTRIGTLAMIAGAHWPSRMLWERPRPNIGAGPDRRRTSNRASSPTGMTGPKASASRSRSVTRWKQRGCAKPSPASLRVSPCPPASTPTAASPQNRGWRRLPKTHILAREPLLQVHR